MNKETIALAAIAFCKDRTKPCPVCSEPMDVEDHLECRKALRRTKGGRKHIKRYDNLDYWDWDRWH